MVQDDGKGKDEIAAVPSRKASGFAEATPDMSEPRKDR